MYILSLEWVKGTLTSGNKIGVDKWREFSVKSKISVSYDQMSIVVKQEK